MQYPRYIRDKSYIYLVILFFWTSKRHGQSFEMEEINIIEPQINFPVEDRDDEQPLFTPEEDYDEE